MSGGATPSGSGTPSSAAPGRWRWAGLAAAAASAAAAAVYYAVSRRRKRPRYERRRASASAAAATSAAAAAPAEMVWGHMPGGDPVRLFVLRNAAGQEATVCELGATLVGLTAPDRGGRMEDVVLGFERLSQYVAEHPSVGSTCGRVANRVARARLALPGDAAEHRLSANWKGHTLHGGERGFGRRLWRGEARGPASVSFSLASRDGDMGFPGRLDAECAYTLTDDGELEVRMTARASGRATACNLANHAYYNLAGHGSGTVLDHRLRVYATEWTPADADLIPTGEVADVRGTPVDFTRMRRVGDAVGELAGNEATGGGLDHNLMLMGGGGAARSLPDRGGRGEPLLLAAQLEEPRSGRTMDVYTTAPALQVYSANWLDGTLAGKGGAVYARHAGICLETQHPPDAVHHPGFPSVVLAPGEQYSHVMLLRFGVVGAE